MPRSGCEFVAKSTSFETGLGNVGFLQNELLDAFMAHQTLQCDAQADQGVSTELKYHGLIQRQLTADYSYSLGRFQNQPMLQLQHQVEFPENVAIE